MNNPINMIKMMMGKMTPEQMATQMLSNSDNPMAQNLLELAKNNDNKGIEAFARNIMKTQGRDFDKEFGEFMNNFK